MRAAAIQLAYLVAATLFIIGLRQLSSAKTAPRGNLTAALGMLIAVVATLLVIVSAGVAYEENPTISYTPLGGEEFLRKMLAPVSLSQMLLISNMVSLHPQVKQSFQVRRNGKKQRILDREIKVILQRRRGL